MKLFCRHLDKPLIFVKNVIGTDKKSVWKCPDCGKIIFRPDPFYIGEVSDGSHTFDELYYHRAVLFSIICNNNPDISWKSKKHADGSMYKNMFIVGINTPMGPATYHYYIDPYWYMFNVKELENAPEWDGHTPAQAIERIESLNPNITIPI